MELNTIYQKDCLEMLRSMENDSVDLVVTSPPYNKGFYADKHARTDKHWSALNGRKIAYDEYGDSMNPDEYESWQRNILSECLRVLKPSGSIFYNHKDVIYRGTIVPPRWVYDYPLRQQIIWNRGSSLMVDPRYFYPITEYIYWIVKNPKEVYFDKDMSLFKDSVWRILPDKNPHPAPFPLKMVSSIVMSNCPEGGVVFDPFMGSGTTALAVVKIGGGGSTSVRRYLRDTSKWQTKESARN